jgi:hypothetical protein
MIKVAQSGIWLTLGPIFLAMGSRLGSGGENWGSLALGLIGAAMIVLTLAVLSGLIQRQQEELDQLKSKLSPSSTT